MQIEFKKQYLKDLFEGKVSPYKKYRSNPQLVQQYIKTINKLRAATHIEQLYQIHSLRYEKKQGDLAGISAVWINRQYRILFREVSTQGEGLTIDLLEIQELSKHYES
ncbi:type II toxin-antitoxin system RelE/ParE family toxin [Pontibacter sp. G13]|uniref:type II toxin-antitoxin system RelE/ParE family toxin n=1 Tax=Pontibacter sp. G13 TaxID=3074898 RepID=UPI00288A789D|nr:type II toxin-antitoxin system RelE/ParE family toxin [Pontibacter sp. G13]WNJ19828.1 type II toxin-antitoxin system RelE/ParE family toxin [Pontibacter sp. G13]